MLIGSLQKNLDYLHRLLKLFNELFVFLVPPCIPQIMEMTLQGGTSITQFRVELLEVGGEPPQFHGIDNCLTHASRL